MTDQLPHIVFDNSYVRDLEGFYVESYGEPAPAPAVLRLNRNLASELGLDADVLSGPGGAELLTGTSLPDGAASIAMAYAGHQFGGFSPQLGDGRALLVGEIIDRQGSRRDIHLKGSGRTVFSRGGDGKAAIGPVLREYLIAEAMHALAIPTTRALAASLTGEDVMRDGPEKGAVLARVAASHLRVGTFQFFAARSQTDKVRQLADYAILRHYPEVAGSDDRYLEFFRKVRDAQARLIARWVLAGFVHGVMNTDNMTISGETIDYGPCAFIDTYDPKAVFSSIDQFGRYAYGNQPNIAQWNLARFAETLIELVSPGDSETAVGKLTDELGHFPFHYQHEWLKGMRKKLGLIKELPGDLDLANDLYTAMEGQNVDFTQLFRALAGAVRGDSASARGLFDDPATGFDAWLARYLDRCAGEALEPNDRAAAMDRSNPLYIPRNHKVEEALTSAGAGDMTAFDRLLEVLTRPFETQDGAESYAEPAPAGFGHYTTYCGT
ncbi:MAG: YdiU family protein [Alphaproteobacteria bacterium]|nr:YdiU family protein [Alphaproteobacteria bacterium]